MAGGLLDKEANLKKTSLNLKDKLFSDLLFGFQALLLVKVLASKLVTHLRDIMVAAWYDWQLWLQRPRYKAQKQILWTRSRVVLCWCSVALFNQPANKKGEKSFNRSKESNSLILWTMYGARNIQPTKRKTKIIEPTNPQDNKILPFERCPRPSYWAPPVPQTPRSPLCLRSSYLPLPVKGLFTHFTHLERNFLSHSIHLLNMVLKLIKNTINKKSEEEFKVNPCVLQEFGMDMLCAVCTLMSLSTLW